MTDKPEFQYEKVESEVKTTEKKKRGRPKGTGNANRVKRRPGKVESTPIEKKYCQGKHVWLPDTPENFPYHPVFGTEYSKFYIDDMKKKGFK